MTNPVNIDINDNLLKSHPGEINLFFKQTANERSIIRTYILEKCKFVAKLFNK